MFEAQVKHAEPETVAFLAMRGSYDQTPMGYGQLYGWVAQHGLEPTGPPCAVYLTPPGEVSEGEPMWELWAPVAERADAPPDDTGIGVKHVPGHEVASTMHHGPYDEVEDAYRELIAWVGGHGYVLAGPPQEVYFSDPDEVPPEQYLTEIRFPVVATRR